jgi:hypothetical protein
MEKAIPSPFRAEKLEQVFVNLLGIKIDWSVKA